MIINFTDKRNVGLRPKTEYPLLLLSVTTDIISIYSLINRE